MQMKKIMLAAAAAMLVFSVFATPATVASRAFQRELAFRAIGVDVEAQPCGGVVDAIDGTVIPMPAESILIHSDTAGAVELATTIKDSVAAAGYTVRPYAD